ncbi:NAD(P)H-hydrate dehydratase [Candidatus Methylacidithermus pantelleriae]|uniref:Bifunctional NAD(P)H-hydrate repair enzyme n=1 Tax=Candidatus Methylacidithermus pantelleriae TaxID=2744239 RepID=A0A8J2BPV2_9BACT|nr:NAD(P)H-hydrate dehydratase [Candidatus Methylacidithermus pantelleriae]CAF0688932.1 NAD(P)H-hydrate epimerase,ADP-dependent (S)-NAD(P)H-hydrate dehydratase [Candidatus Methylacidithermus pantelleriae]
MRILTATEIRELEAREVSRGVSEEILMERAGKGMARVCLREWDRPCSVVVLVGKGNNGGDGLVLARELARFGWPVSVVLTAWPEAMSPLCAKKWKEISSLRCVSVCCPGQPIPWPGGGGLVVDALLGIGVKGEVQEPLRSLFVECNRQRSERFFSVLAVDCPSGLSEGFQPGWPVIGADLTATVGYGKEFLFREEFADYVGRIEVVPIFEEQPSGEGAEALVPSSLAYLLPPRPKLCHKGQFGRVLIIGGSLGFAGAVVMAAQAAHGVGAGLVCVATRDEVYTVVASKAPAETMVFRVENRELLTQLAARSNAIGFGPGIGLDSTAVELARFLVENTRCPMVWDADALTLLAHHPELWTGMKKRAIVTPHPGEMRRLLGRDFALEERPFVAQELATEKDCIVVLKGVRTVVASPTRPLRLNTTGNPGLAAGGSGDTLTGVLVGLLAQGLSIEDAAGLGVWLHGRAADLAVRYRKAEEGLTATEVGRMLGQAIHSLRQEGWTPYHPRTNDGFGGFNPR